MTFNNNKKKGAEFTPINYHSREYVVWVRAWKDSVQKKFDKSVRISNNKIAELENSITREKNWNYFFIWISAVSITTSIAQYYY